MRTYRLILTSLVVFLMMFGNLTPVRAVEEEIDVPITDLTGGNSNYEVDPPEYEEEIPEYEEEDLEQNEVEFIEEVPEEYNGHPDENEVEITTLEEEVVFEGIEARIGETITVAKWNFSNNAAAAVLPSFGGEQDSVSEITHSKGKIISRPGAVNSYFTIWQGSTPDGNGNWDTGDYWQIKTSTKDTKNIVMEDFRAYSTANGPDFFEVLVSVDGTNFVKIHEYSIPTATPDAAAGLNVSGFNISELALEEGLDVDDQEELYIRLVATVTSTGANRNSRLANITITGTLDAAILPVVASIETGSVLPKNAAVTLSTETEGATIVYTLNGGAEQTITSNSGDAIITEFDINGQATIVAKAELDGSYSTAKTFVYTQETLEIVPNRSSGRIPSGTVIQFTANHEDTEFKYVLTTNVGEAEEATSGELVYDKNFGIAVADELFPISITVKATHPDYRDSLESKLDYTLKVGGNEQIYFGNLHAHTTLSDGAGTPEEALAFARDVAGVDFLAITDHSNLMSAGTGFDSGNASDTAGTYNLYDYNATNENWVRVLEATEDATTPDFLGIRGYEMTWSGGPGHINTFFTTGVVSRQNTELNNKTNYSGLRAYYELLKQTPESISQFNHPGATFGTFGNFAFYDPIIGERITLLEVGNGEGAIGTGGYFPSYEYYTMALDKGWMVAPTNNQDNHRKTWGNGNTARTAIYTNDFSLDGFRDAFRERSVYATEIEDLELYYTVNGYAMGEKIDAVPAVATFSVEIINPTDTNKVRSVSLITNGGIEIGKQDFNTQNASYEHIINNPMSGYYYVKVVNTDGRIAVSAPIWIGEGRPVGITEVNKDVAMAVTDEEITLTTTLFNIASSAATVTNIEYRDGDTVLANISNPGITIPASGEATHEIKYTPTVAAAANILVIATVSVGGSEVTLTYNLDYTVYDSSSLLYIAIDGAHYNEYVSGNYKDSMTNLTTLAADYGIRVNVLMTESDLIAALENPQYVALILTPPSRRLYQNPAQYKSYSQDVLDAIVQFAENGNTIVVTNWSHTYENYDGLVGMPATETMSAQQNQVLAALGSQLRVSDDASSDPNVYHTDEYRIFLDDSLGAYHFTSPLLNDVLPEQRYSQYGGTTIYTVAPENKTQWDAPSTDSVSEGVIPAVVLSELGSPKDRKTRAVPNAYNASPTQEDGRYIILASEEVTHSNGTTSLVIVSGGSFMSNFEVASSTPDNMLDVYANTQITINLLKSLVPQMELSTIAEVKEGTPGTQYMIEGIVTSSTMDTGSGFYDSIYIQDATGGINLHPISEGVYVGQTIRVIGTLSSFQGEIQLGTVSSVEIIDSEIKPVNPTVVTTEEAGDSSNLGLLIETRGIVSDIVENYVDGVRYVDEFKLTDATGKSITVFTNSYITVGVNQDDIIEGAEAIVTGLASFGEVASGGGYSPRIRVRDRAEIIIIPQAQIATLEYVANPQADVPIYGIPTGTFEFKIGDTITVHPEIPTKEGYVFLYYQAVGLGRSVAGMTVQPGETFIIKGHLQLVAQWALASDPTTPINPTPPGNAPDTGVNNYLPMLYGSSILALGLLIILRKKSQKE